MKRCLLSLLALGACLSWSPPEAPAPSRHLEGNPKAARVVLTDGTVMLLGNPTLIADTLSGYTQLYDNADTTRITIPTSRVRTIEVARFSALRSTLFVVGFVVLVAGGALAWIAAHPYT